MASVHGLGLTGVERAWAEYAPGRGCPLARKYACQWQGNGGVNLSLFVGFRCWLAGRGLELGVSRDRAWFRVVKAGAVDEVYPSGRNRFGSTRWRGMQVCYGLPASAFPMDIREFGGEL